VVTVLAAALVGDAVRAALDPRSAESRAPMGERPAS
jgi:ABC-type dipeptide/oligopeptide/nickel transport system permease subunit